jgi:hypothetical protein
MNHLTLIFALSLSVLAPKAWADLSGLAADGCSFQVINGVYMHSCSDKGGQAGRGNQATATSARRGLVANETVASETITSYSSVQMRSAPLSLSPPALSAAPARPTLVSSLEGQNFRSAQDIQEERLIRSLVERTFVSLSAGTASTKGSGAEGLGLGVSLGTNLDEFFGAEIGYSFSRQSMNLGLENRQGSASVLDSERSSLASQWPVAGSSRNSRATSNNDSSLANHLFAAEVQGHLTSVRRRLRPFLGAGLSWRSSQLEEEELPAGVNGGVLRQSSLNASGSAGAKLRVGRNVQLAFAFRYISPLLKQESQLDAPQATARSGLLAPTSKLEAQDSRLTSASLTQLIGGVQVYF